MKDIIYKIIDLIDESDLGNPNKWNEFKIDHTHPYENYKHNYKIIDGIFKNKNINGIYCYYDDTTPIYIGKGRPISYRLKSHFKEANKLANESRGKYWNEFFGKKEYRKELTVRWIEIDYEDTKTADLFREAVEAFLSYKFQFSFDIWYKKRKSEDKINQNKSIK